MVSLAAGIVQLDQVKWDSVQVEVEWEIRHTLQVHYEEFLCYYVTQFEFNSVLSVVA